MDLTAFESRLGLGQGRIRPAGVEPVTGEHVFVLGEDQPGRFFDLAAGDHAEVVQEVDLSGVDLVLAHLHMRVPASLPANLAWEASILVDGMKLASATCLPGRRRTISDLAANVSRISGLHVVGVRLELVEP